MHILGLELEELEVLVCALTRWLGIRFQYLESHLLEALTAILIYTLVAEWIHEILAQRSLIRLILTERLALRQ